MFHKQKTHSDYFFLSLHAQWRGGLLQLAAFLWLGSTADAESVEVRAEPWSAHHRGLRLQVMAEQNQQGPVEEDLGPHQGGAA